MAKLMDVSDSDVALIEDVIAERLAVGVSQPVAQRQAVDEALAQLAEERSMVMKAVMEQLAKTPDMFPEEFATKRTKGDSGVKISSKGDTLKGANVNSDGQKITATKQGVDNFWKWFGDSVAVDEKGRPLVLYHSTNADTDVLKAGQKTTNNYGLLGDVELSRAGIFATADRKFSQEYLRSGDGKNVMQIYMSLRNPFDTRDGISYEVEQQLIDAGVSSRWLYDYRQHDWEMYDNADDGTNFFVEKLKELGYDGAVFNEEGQDGEMHTTYMAFDSNQIKSATGNLGTFNPEDNRITFSNKKSALGFYSALSTAIDGINAKAQPADGWKAQIKGLISKGAVKADEVEWTGLNDWLDLQTGKVTKEAVQAYLDGNGVRVEEVTLKDPRYDEWIPEDSTEEYGPEESMPAKYGQYTLPGGENYREVLLTLPVTERNAAGMAEADRLRDEAMVLDKQAMAAWTQRGDMEEFTRLNDQARELRQRASAAEKAGGTESFKFLSSHWDQPNVLAHIRLNDRTDADGKRVLFVEEIQSDWGQLGKKDGFVGDLEKQLPVALQKTREAQRHTGDVFDRLIAEGLSEKQAHDHPDFVKAYEEERAAKKAYGDMTLRSKSTTPAAPFVTKTEGWLNLALKRIMVMAAEGGYDRVAFVNGEQSADRYDLSKQVKQVMAKKEGDEFIIFVRDSAGKNHNMGVRSANELPDVVGKELAEKIASQKKDMEIYEGLDLKVGGEGMKTFYDSIVPKAVNELLRKLKTGAKLGEVAITGNKDIRKVRDDDGTFALEERREDEFGEKYWEPIAYNLSEQEANDRLKADGRAAQPGFDVTDAMRERVDEGMPLFSNKRAVTETPEFKRWFGDSKVVDAEGKPLVVYHGTPNVGFTEFGTGNVGAFFSDRFDIAASYAGRYNEVDFDEEGPYADDMQGVYQTYLSLKNPLVLDWNGGDWGRGQEGLKLDDWAVRAKRGGYDGLIVNNVVDTGFLSPGLVEDNGLGTVYVAFDPTQIKSAIGNNGQFDPENPDIRFANRAQTGSNWEAPEDTKFDRMVYALQDGRIDLKRVQEEIDRASTSPLAEAFDARQAETLYAGRVADRADLFLKNEAKPLLEVMAKNNVTMDELSDYLLARHAAERNAQIAKVNPSLPDGGAGTNSQGVLMTNAAAAAHVSALTPSRKLLLDMLAKRIDTITKGTRDLLVAEGLETQDAIDNWQGAYKHYVPLFKEEAQGDIFSSHPMGSGFSVTGKASKRATGSTKEVTNMLAHVLMQREAAITRAEKNRVALSLYGLALSNPNPDFWVAIRPNMSDADLAQSLQDMGIDPTAMADMDKAPMVNTISPTTGKVVRRPNPLYQDKPYAIVVKVAGEDRVILFNTGNERATRLVANLKNLDGAGMEFAQKTIGRVTRFMASMATQYNPLFGVKNVVRDTLGGLVNLSSTPLKGKQLAVIGNLAKAAYGIATDLVGSGRTNWSDLYAEFRAEGGQTGFKEAMRTSFERTAQLEKELKHLQSQGKLTPRNALMAVLNGLDGFNTTLENTVRLATYKVAKDNGMSNAQAAKIARELTVDFNRKGSWTKGLSPFYAFFNAAVQGNARTLVTLTTGKTGAAIVAGGVTLGIIQAVMLAAAGFDDDEISEFAKTRAFIIPIGGKKYISIPMPLGLHVLPNTGRVIAELAQTEGKNMGKKAWSAFGEIAGSFSPLGGGDIATAGGWTRIVLPTAVDPLADLSAGVDFAGRPISKMGGEMDPRPGYLRGRENLMRKPSGEVYKLVAQGVNAATGGREFMKGRISPTPEEVRYATMAVGGGLLRELERGTDAAIMAARGDEVKPYQIPLASGFYGEVDDAQVQKSRYYENNKKIEALAAELKALRNTGQGAKANALMKDEPLLKLKFLNDSVEQQLRALNKQANNNIADPAKLKELDAKRAARMKALNDKVREMEKAAALVD